MSLIQTVTKTIYTTKDGKQFETMAEAEAHQFSIENADKIALAVDSYLNSRELKNRSRKQKETIAADFYAFLLTWDGEMIERTVMDDEEVAPAVTAEEVPAAEVEVEGVEATEAPAEEATAEDDMF